MAGELPRCVKSATAVLTAKVRAVGMVVELLVTFQCSCVFETSKTHMTCTPLSGESALASSTNFTSLCHSVRTRHMFTNLNAGVKQQATIGTLPEAATSRQFMLFPRCRHEVFRSMSVFSVCLKRKSSTRLRKYERSGKISCGKTAGKLFQ